VRKEEKNKCSNILRTQSHSETLEMGRGITLYQCLQCLQQSKSSV